MFVSYFSYPIVTVAPDKMQDEIETRNYKTTGIINT